MALTRAGSCVVYCRLSCKQHQMSCFHKIVRQHYSGEVGEFIIILGLCEISRNSVHQKVLYSWFIFASYSKYKRRGAFLRHKA